MWEYLVMLVCIGLIIFFRLKAFRKSFGTSLLGYSDPDETARDFILKARKGMDPKFKAYLEIKNLQHFINLNLGYLTQNSNKTKRNICSSLIFIYINKQPLFV